MVVGGAVGVVALLTSLVSGPRAWLHSNGRLHVWYHLGLFFLLGLLAMHRSLRPSLRLCWVIAAVMLGFAIECGEAIRYDGLLEWVDVRTDTLGVLIGAAVGWLVWPGAQAPREDLED